LRVGPVDRGRLEIDPEIRRFLDVAEELRRPEERLGGDATAVKASPAEPLVFFDDGRLQTELTGADGRDIAARPGTDDPHVERLSHVALRSPEMELGQITLRPPRIKRFGPCTGAGGAGEQCPEEAGCGWSSSVVA